jgi:non-specific serine/threonine protein kinase/serine/threonine-protein kinase
MSEPAEGRTIGPYRLLKLIGEGGMGEVYLAERENEFRKRVAIKLIRAGMDSQDVVRRFVMERHLLAALNHPHIVRLVDGGATDDGLPYLVVDYVEGVAIDVYCEQHKLPVSDRLRLFIDVCDAVHHAHQSLIIHCDLKPGNILVTAEGNAMLLDFGIGKLVDPVKLGMSTQTMTRLRAYTPNYASPEQLRGEPVTTVTDIYALGVILFELLTGQSPYRVSAADSLVDWVRSVCDDDTEAPSRTIKRETPALRRRLEGDLDAITLKALRKDPRDRYGSVDQMAEDIRRHLDGRPVLARRNTAGYVARKFLQRHKFGAIAAALVLLSMGAGLASTLWEARIAARRFDDVRGLAHAFLFDVYDAVQNLPGSTQARSLIAKTGAEYLDRLAQDARGNSELELELAQGYLKLGDVEGNPFMGNKGDTAKGLVNYRKALAIAEGEVARHPKDEKAREVLAGAYLGLASVLPFRGQSKEGLNYAQHALDIYRRIAAAHANSVEHRLDVGRAAETVGDIQGGLQGINLGLTEEARASYRQAIAAIPDVPQGSEFFERASRAKAVMLAKIADVSGRNTLPAEETYKSALKIAEGLLDRDPNNTKSQAVVTSILNRLATSETQVGDAKGALEAFRKSMAINDNALALDPSNERARGGVAVDRKNLGDLYMYVVQDAAQALRYYQQAADLLEEDVRRDPRNMIWSTRLSETLTDVASCLIAVGKPEQAVKPAQRGLQFAKEAADQPGATMTQIYNYAWLAISVDPESLRNFGVALPYAQRAVEMSHGQDPECLYVLAQAYAGTGRWQEAVDTAEKALALYPPAAAGQPVSHNQAVVERAVARYKAQMKKR